MKFDADSGSMDSKNYIRLKDKESIVGLFVGDPYTFKMHWVQGKGALCTAPQCPHCVQGVKAAFRFRANIIIKDGETNVAKIFEQGWTVYEALKHLNNDYDLEKHFVKITRTGSGPQDTAYSILPVKNGELKQDQAKRLALVVLHDLKHKVEVEVLKTNEPPPPSFNSDEEIPF